MLKYIGRRLLMMIPVMLGVILIVFTLMYITPGDPVDTLLGDDATPEMAEQLREELGLNGTYIERLGKYLVNLAHGDLGICYSTKQPVMDRIIQTFPNSLKLAGCSVLLSVAIGLTLGIVSAAVSYTHLWNNPENSKQFPPPDTGGSCNNPQIHNPPPLSCPDTP